MVTDAKPVGKQVLGTAPVCRPVIGMITVAAMMGGFFIIIEDPIFGGLAVSLIVGLFVSTLLTLFVIPAVYYQWRRTAVTT